MEKLFDSMNFDSVRRFYWVYICIQIFYARFHIGKELLILIPLIIVIMGNDRLRMRKKLSFNKYIFSLIVSNVLGFIIGVFYVSDIAIYLCCLGSEIIYYNLEKLKKLFYLNIFFIGFIFLYVRNYFQRGLGEGILLLIMTLIPFLAFYSMAYYMKANIEERSRVEVLNKELKEYSEKIEELTLKNERNRIASEMHDSLGHSLTAVRMNLEFGKNIIDKDSHKAKKIMNTCEEIVSSSINELRRTVYELKEENIDFIKSIENMIHNLNNVDDVEVIFEYNDDFNKCRREVQNCLYRTIQEGITNSMKHGMASKINIDLSYNIEDGIVLKIIDNGKGCPLIVENQGLKGIRDRVDKLEGMANFWIHEGFNIEVRL